MTIDCLRVWSMTLFVVGSFLVVNQSAEAQGLATEDVVLEEIWAEARDNSQFMSLSQALLDSLGPRLTGSSSMEHAQDWAVNRLESWGVEARIEPYGTWEGWDRGVSHVDLVAPRIRSDSGLESGHWRQSPRGPCSKLALDTIRRRLVGFSWDRKRKMGHAVFSRAYL